MPRGMKTGSLRLLLLLLMPLLCRAQDAKLSTLTDDTLSKWLTGTEWKGESAGRHAHLWFATPGIVVRRREFNPADL